MGFCGLQKWSVMERTSESLRQMAGSLCTFQVVETARNRGIFEAIFAALSADADMENLSIDSTSCTGGKFYRPAEER